MRDGAVPLPGWAEEAPPPHSQDGPRRLRLPTDSSLSPLSPPMLVFWVLQASPAPRSLAGTISMAHLIDRHSVTSISHPDIRDVPLSASLKVSFLASVPGPCAYSIAHSSALRSRAAARCLLAPPRRWGQEDHAFEVIP